MTEAVLDRTFRWKSFLLSPKGRVTRFDFWVHFFLPAIVLAVATSLTGYALGMTQMLAAAFTVALCYPFTVIGIKRLHDRNRTGWWVVISFIPVIGPLWAALALGVLPGTYGENRFGPDAGDRNGSALAGMACAAAAVLTLVLLASPRLVMSPYTIPSGASIPTLMAGDLVFVSKFAYGYSNNALPFGSKLISGRVFSALPERGDFVVFKLPRDNKTDYIKRIVGLPGERIQVKGGILHIDDAPVRRDRIEDLVVRDGFGNEQRFTQYDETLPNGRVHRIIEIGDNLPGTDNTPVYQVPPNHFFVLGDNRDNSQDSRFLTQVGYIPLENLVGRAEFLTRGFAFHWVQ